MTQSSASQPTPDPRRAAARRTAWIVAGVAVLVFLLSIANGFLH